MVQRATNGIKEQIQRKMGHVLLFSLEHWACERLRMGHDATLTSYTKYVATIVGPRLVKLLVDGFDIGGFLPRLVDFSFVCNEGGYATQIDGATICSTSMDDIPPPGRINDVSDLDIPPPGRINDVSDLDDYDDDIMDVKPYFWCEECVQWHALVERLL